MPFGSTQGGAPTNYGSATFALPDNQGPSQPKLYSKLTFTKVA